MSSGSGGRSGGGLVNTAAGMVKWMGSSILNLVLGVAILVGGFVAVSVVVPYAGFMAWHHDNLQLGADKGTAFVVWEYTVIGATFEGGTRAAPAGFDNGQELTQKSLGNKSINP